MFPFWLDQFVKLGAPMRESIITYPICSTHYGKHPCWNYRHHHHSNKWLGRIRWDQNFGRLYWSDQLPKDLLPLMMLRLHWQLQKCQLWAWLLWSKNRNKYSSQWSLYSVIVAFKTCPGIRQLKCLTLNDSWKSGLVTEIQKLHERFHRT